MVNKKGKKGKPNNPPPFLTLERRNTLFLLTVYQSFVSCRRFPGVTLAHVLEVCRTPAVGQAAIASSSAELSAFLSSQTALGPPQVPS